LELAWVINGQAIQNLDPTPVLATTTEPVIVDHEAPSDDDIAVSTTSVPEMLLSEHFPGIQEIS
jgi:hypothetical protein